MIKDNPKIIRAWTFYDWANSVFPLVITSAIFPNFYDYVTTHDESKKYIGDQIHAFGGTFQNQDIFSFVYAFALSIVVLIVPILSGVADYMGNKKKFLKFFCYLGAFSCMGLYFFNRENIELSFLPFILATVGFWGSLVYYNSYLPEIASPENQDKVSARGFAMGYFGSSLLLILCLLMILVLKVPAKYSFLLVGVWWIGFAQIPFSGLPDTQLTKERSKENVFTKGFKELKSVQKDVFSRTKLKRFLMSYFFYNMGVQTVMVMAVLFARKEITWPDEQTKTSSLIVSILLIQFLGIAGSFLFSKLSSITDNVKSLGLAILIWIFICVFTYKFAYLPSHFYFVAAMVGLVMGGIQSLSRSTYSKLLPVTDDSASYFSFYDVVEKLGMIIGTTSFGLISLVSGGMRNSVLLLIVFFVLGLFLLLQFNRIKNSEHSS